MLIRECSFEPILIDSRCFRKGILLTLTTHNDKKTTAEISPLPGFNKETFEDALHQLQNLKRRLVTTWWTRQAVYYLENLGLYPSVFFGVESALLDLLDPLPESELPSSYGFLLGSPQEILDQTSILEKEGFYHVKVKLGHLIPEIAHQIIQKIGNKFRLRIDLNRKWSFEETSQFCAQYPPDFFEYIEEPVSKFQDLEHFSFPFALDETLRQNVNFSSILQSKYLKAFIIKPTLTYPIYPLLNLAASQVNKKLEIVLTSSFESIVGISQIRNLIQRLNLPKTYHGLDTLRYFESQNEPLPYRTLESTAT